MRTDKLSPLDRKLLGERAKRGEKPEKAKKSKHGLVFSEIPVVDEKDYGGGWKVHKGVIFYAGTDFGENPWGDWGNFKQEWYANKDTPNEPEDTRTDAEKFADEWAKKNA